MNKIYVCSPFRTNKLFTEKENIENAIKYARQVIEQGDMPIVPHLMYPQILDDSKDSDREKGINFDLELILLCDKVYVFGDFISDGMRKEIQFAQKSKMRIEFLTSDKI